MPVRAHRRHTAEETPPKGCVGRRTRELSSDVAEAPPSWKRSDDAASALPPPPPWSISLSWLRSRAWSRLCVAYDCVYVERKSKAPHEGPLLKDSRKASLLGVPTRPPVMVLVLWMLVALSSHGRPASLRE